MLKEFFGAEPLLPDNGARLVAIGQELDLSRTEFYFRLQSSQLEYWQVGYLLRRVGLEARQVDLLSLLEEVRGFALTQARPKLPEGVYGFSFSFSSQGEPTVFSLFTFAETLLGTDGQIRQTLLSIAQQKGWDFRRYAALSEPLANWTQKHQHHNAIAFVVTPNGSPSLYISLSPPCDK